MPEPLRRTPTHSSSTIGTSSVTLLPKNAERFAALIQNDSAATVYIRIDGVAAQTSTGIRIAANGGSYEMSDQIGNLSVEAITAIAGSADNNVIVTEFDRV